MPRCRRKAPGCRCLPDRKKRADRCGDDDRRQKNGRDRSDIGAVARAADLRTPYIGLRQRMKYEKADGEADQGRRISRALCRSTGVRRDVEGQCQNEGRCNTSHDTRHGKGQRRNLVTRRKGKDDPIALLVQNGRGRHRKRPRATRSTTSRPARPPPRNGWPTRSGTAAVQPADSPSTRPDRSGILLRRVSGIMVDDVVRRLPGRWLRAPCRRRRSPGSEAQLDQEDQRRRPARPVKMVQPIAGVRFIRSDVVTHVMMPQRRLQIGGA
ncbi:Uncharacterised protein [Sphingomonas paucimobilis]|nr:Uncharacterised protein [Sphingomonas paucimobilis]